MILWLNNSGITLKSTVFKIYEFGRTKFTDQVVLCYKPSAEMLARKELSSILKVLSTPYIAKCTYLAKTTLLEFSLLLQVDTYVAFNSYPDHPPPGHPRAFAQKIFPAPGHLTVNLFPAPGHLTNPGIFKMCTVFTV